MLADESHRGGADGFEDRGVDGSEEIGHGSAAAAAVDEPAGLALHGDEEVLGEVGGEGGLIEELGKRRAAGAFGEDCAGFVRLRLDELRDAEKSLENLLDLGPARFDGLRFGDVVPGEGVEARGVKGGELVGHGALKLGNLRLPERNSVERAVLHPLDEPGEGAVFDGEAGFGNAVEDTKSFEEEFAAGSHGDADFFSLEIADGLHAPVFARDDRHHAGGGGDRSEDAELAARKGFVHDGRDGGAGDVDFVRVEGLEGKFAEGIVFDLNLESGFLEPAKLVGQKQRSGDGHGGVADAEGLRGVGGGNESDGAELEQLPKHEGYATGSPGDCNRVRGSGVFALRCDKSDAKRSARGGRIVRWWQRGVTLPRR